MCTSAGSYWNACDGDGDGGGGEVAAVTEGPSVAAAPTQRASRPPPQHGGGRDAVRPSVLVAGHVYDGGCEGGGDGGGGVGGGEGRYGGGGEGGGGSGGEGGSGKGGGADPPAGRLERVTGHHPAKRAERGGQSEQGGQ